MAGLAAILFALVSYSNAGGNFFTGAGYVLFFSYLIGLVPALIAAFLIAGLIFLQGRLRWFYILFIAFGTGPIYLFLVTLAFGPVHPGSIIGGGGFGGYVGMLGLISAMLLLPFLQRMSVLKK